MKFFKTLKRYKYRDYLVYIRQFDFIFEYLIIFRGELYSNYCRISPKLWRRCLSNPYTEKQFNNSVLLVQKIAEQTIDELIIKSKINNEIPISQNKSD